jgi:hypothetical protein
MRRLPLTLAVLCVAISSCAVGVRQPATEVTETSAVLNGKVVSTTGGPGSYYISYGAVSPRTERTPTRPIDFVAEESRAVSEPVDGLAPGVTYRYVVCAEDGENPGEPFCSPTQTFKTSGTAVPELRGESICTEQHQYAIEGVATGLEPETDYGVTAQMDSGTGSTIFTTDATGSSGVGSILGTEPFEVRVVIWLNPDGDFVQDPGEPTAIDQALVVDEPCEDARPADSSSSQ